MSAQAAAIAPVVLFAYARPAHLRTTLDALSKNALAAETHLYVYCDAPKRPEHASDVQAVRAMVEKISGFASVSAVYRDTNLGLARSIIAGVTEVLNKHDTVIVVEDDLLVAPHFLQYMNDALACYSADERVASIHGYCYPVDEELPQTFFLRGADCWGWATWRRAWSHFRSDGQQLLRQLRQQHLAFTFDLDGNQPFTRMLEDQVAGRNDSWAIRWHAACFLDNMLTLYPGRSLVHNTGNDASGTHAAATEVFAVAVTRKPVTVLRLPIAENAAARRSFVRFFKRQRAGRFVRVLRRALARIGVG